MATTLDPEFDPWAETIPFAERLAQEELRQGLSDWLSHGLKQARILTGLPERVDDFLTQAERGTVTVQMALSPEARKLIQRLERSALKLVWIVVAAGLVVAAAMVHASRPGEPVDEWLAVLAGLAFLWGVLTKR